MTEEPSSPRCDKEQLAILKRCSEKQDITEWNDYRENNRDTEIWLQAVDLSEAHLEGADLWRAHLEGAHLQEVHLEGANLSEASLQRANCPWCIVDGASLFKRCNVDIDTDFAGVGLDAARVDPGIKQVLQYTIRQKRWKQWYREHRFLQWIWRPFWLLSNYGHSTSRVLTVFFLLAGAFAAAYAWLEWLGAPAVSGLWPEPFGSPWGGYFFTLILRPVYFSIVTMTTLGFGDIYAHPESPVGHILLTVQVLLGYVLLGALITRFAILFTAGGPAGTFTPMSEKQRQYTDLAVQLMETASEDTAKRAELIAQIQTLQDEQAKQPEQPQED